jgi:hypothetical protein
MQKVAEGSAVSEVYDDESRTLTGHFSGSPKPGTGYWAVPTLRVYHHRDLSQRGHLRTLYQCQLSQQRR